MSNEHKEELTEFRLSKLEEAVSSLSTLKDVVLKWDVRFSSSEGFLQCPVHKIKMEEFDKRLIGLETTVEEIKRFVYKAAGALVIISIIVQLAGPVIMDKIHGATAQTPTVEYYQAR